MIRNGSVAHTPASTGVCFTTGRTFDPANPAPWTERAIRA